MHNEQCANYLLSTAEAAIDPEPQEPPADTTIETTESTPQVEVTGITEAALAGQQDSGETVSDSGVSATPASVTEVVEVDVPAPRSGVFFGVPSVELAAWPTPFQPWIWETWDGEVVTGLVPIPETGLGIRVTPGENYDGEPFTFPEGSVTEWWFDYREDYDIVDVYFDLTPSCTPDGRVAVDGTVTTSNFAPGTQAGVQITTVISGPTSLAWPTFLGYLNADGNGSYPVSTIGSQALAEGEHTVHWTIQYGLGNTAGEWAFVTSTPATITCSAVEPEPEPEPGPSDPTEPTDPETPLTPTEPGESIALDLSASSVTAGGSITVTADGFAPGEQYEIWLHSTPVRLATGTASGDGTISRTVTIPTDIDPGAHRIEIRGATSGSAFTPLTVTAASPAGTGDRLATTGANGTLLTVGSIFAALLAAAGTGLLVIRQRVNRLS